MRKNHIYLVGVTILGVSYASLESAISNQPLFVLIVLAYLGLLRLLAEKKGKP